MKLLEDGKASVSEKYRVGELGKGEVGEDPITCVETAKASCPVEVIRTE